MLRAVSNGGEFWRSSATALISYCLEWDYRSSLLNLRPIQGTAEPFFLHLFKGCVLFESLLKGNPTKQPPVNSTLGLCLDFLHNELGIAPNLGIGNTDFPTIIANLAGADDSIQTAIRFTGMVRNTLGHNLGWVVSLDNTNYQRLFTMVSSSCFHAIVTLY